MSGTGTVPGLVQVLPSSRRSIGYARRLRSGLPVASAECGRQCLSDSTAVCGDAAVNPARTRGGVEGQKAPPENDSPAGQGPRRMADAAVVRDWSGEARHAGVCRYRVPLLLLGGRGERYTAAVTRRHQSRLYVFACNGDGVAPSSPEEVVCARARAESDRQAARRRA